MFFTSILEDLSKAMLDLKGLLKIQLEYKIVFNF